MIRRRRRIPEASMATVLWLVAIVVLPSFLQGRFLARAASIPIGAPKQDVAQLLGSPTAIQQPSLLLRTLFPISAESWYYGSPFRLRILGPELDGAVLEFDCKGHV